MPAARNIITLALESMNKLSPGETLDADVGAACLRRLNSIADDLSAGRDLMFRQLITSGAVSGVSLTLGTGAFAAITVGDEIEAMQSDGWPMSPITLAQYNAIYLKTSPGRPEVWAHDGLSTVYLYPAPTDSTVGIVTRANFSSFADLDTVYTMPSGYEGFFAAALAVAMAPSLLGKVSQDLASAERRASFNIEGANVRPATLNTDPMRATRSSSGNSILQGG